MPSVESTVVLQVPLARLFSYYTDPANVVRMAPPQLELRLIEAETPLRKGSRISYRSRPRFMPLEFTWVLRVEKFKALEHFTDVAEQAPLSGWRHSHHFKDLGGGRSQVTDVVSWREGRGFRRLFPPQSMVIEELRATYAWRESMLRHDLEGAPHPEGG